MTCSVRSETPADTAAIRAVHCAAFPTEAEADLVEKLRARRKARVSLVAEVDGEVVGHVLFSPVTVVPSEGTGTHEGLGLAPLAVVPAHQRAGVGKALTRAGLEACRRLEAGFVVVLGHPDYYPRFGFSRASEQSLANEYGADEAFMVLELRAEALPRGGGLARYAPEFAE